VKSPTKAQSKAQLKAQTKKHAKTSNNQDKSPWHQWCQKFSLTVYAVA